MHVQRPLSLLGGATLLFALACGSGDSKTETKSTAAPAASSPAAAVATTAPAAAPAAPAQPQAFQIRAGERSGNDYFFEPSTLNMRVGKATITLNNAGPERPHSLAVRKDGKEIAKIDRTNVNATGQIEFTIDEAGTYEFVCTLPGHADRGQKGTITVART